MCRTFRVLLFASATALAVSCASDPGTSDRDTDRDTGTDTGRPPIDAGTDTGVDVGDTGSDTSEPPARCGDGITDPGEQCDDGPDNSNSAPDACRLDCTDPACGDGVVDTGEQCDDGNRVDDDECSVSCIRASGDLCRPCLTDDACGGDDDACVQLDAGDFCALACRADRDCPDGFVCGDATSVTDDAVRQCLPAAGTCDDCFDPDRDGYGTGAGCDAGADCDQSDPNTHPGATELCDGLDNDCDGLTDEGLEGSTYYPDADRDGFGAEAGAVTACAKPRGYVDRPGDCDDEDPRTHNSAEELCDEIDNDCDELVDEDATETSFWPDADNDGFGESGATPESSCAPLDGYVTNDDDCDDGNGLVGPGADEICDSGLDDDCDGDIDCADSDCAGSPDCSTTTCPDDGFENNDTRAAATAIGAGTFSDLVSCTADDDFYALNLAAGDELELAVRFASADGDVDMTLVDSEGRTVAASTSVTDDEEIGLTIAAAGTYFVRVYLFADSGAAGVEYTLEVGITSTAPTCRDDGYENNDTRATASAASEGLTSGLVVCPGDADYFAIDLAAGDEITVTADFVDAEGDIDVRIFSGDGTVVASGLGVTDDEIVGYTATRSGTYTIEIALYADAGSPGNTYTLDIDIVSAGPACDTDSFENNDTAATAAAIGPGEYAALLVCGDDQDYYAIELGVGDTIAVEVSFGFFDGNVDIDLRNPAGTVVASSTGLFATTESFEYVARMSGRFVLNVRQAFDPFGESTEYDMTVAVDRAPATCTEDRLEQNDTQATARAIGEGTVGELASCSGDDDFYAIELGAGDTIDVSLDFSDAEGDIDLRLLDGTGAVVASSLSTTDDESLSHVAATSGRYTIRVNLFADAGSVPGNTYGLTVAVDRATPACPSDRLENNDSRGDAEPLPPELYTNLSVCEDDEDWYRVVLGSGDTISVYLTFTHADGDVDVQLQNSVGAVLTSSASTTDDEELHYTTTAAGTYYIRVLLYADSGAVGASYDIEVDVDAAATSCSEDDYEDNDTVDSAVSVGEETVTDLRSCEDDDDYYVTYMIAGETITVEATFTHAEGDIDMSLLDDDGTVVARSVSATNNERIVYEAPADGTYTIRVYLYADAGSSEGNDYDLAVSFAAPDLTCPGGDRFEPNNSESTATPIDLGYVWGLLACTGDSDYYEVLLFAGEEFELDVFFDHADGDVDVYVTDPAGDSVGSGTTTSDDENVTFDVETTGYYTIEVIALSGTGAPYEMLVSAF